MKNLIELITKDTKELKLFLNAGTPFTLYGAITIGLAYYGNYPSFEDPNLSGLSLMGAGFIIAGLGVGLGAYSEQERNRNYKNQNKQEDICQNKK